MSPLKLCLWKHWFWITNAPLATMARRRAISVLLVAILCQAQLATLVRAAPVGAVDTKNITFKKLALDDGAGGGEGKGLGEKPTIAAALMVGRRVTRINLANSNDSPEDAIGDVMDGHEEISRIFVTLPTTTTSTSTTEAVSSSTIDEMRQEKEATGAIVSSTSQGEENATVDHNEEEEEKKNKKEEVIELSSAQPEKSNSTETNQRQIEADDVDGTPSDAAARIIHLSASALDTETNGAIPGMSIEDSEKKIDNQNIQNLVLQDEEDVSAIELSGNQAAVNRSRKSKGLTDNQTNKSSRSTTGGGGDEEEHGESAEPSNPEARLQTSAILNRNLLIQFSDNDRMELLNSQNNALTSDDEEVARSRSTNVGLISGISFSVLALFCAVSLVGAMLYRRRFINKPQTLSEPDSSGYIDDSIIRENSDEMYSLDNDSFLNSLEAMTIQNYWTDHVKHTKL